MDVKFVRYSPHTSGHSLTAQLVECYRDVFAGAPWHELLRCPECKQYWGAKDKELLHSMGYRHCSVPLVDFWAREKVLSSLHEEITSLASCWLAMDGDKVVGFCWGYPVTKGTVEAHLKIEVPMDARTLSEPLIGYQDEVGVLSSHRGRKLAKRMVALRHDDFLARGLTTGVVRTREFPEPSVTYLWYTRTLGYKIVARYPGDDGRVILARPLDGLRELLS